jgi:hypothetical protein
VALPNLRELHLSDSLVGPAGVARLATAPALEALSLPAGSPAGEVIKALAGSRSIRRVSFPGGGLTEEAVAALAAAKKLHWLQSPPAPGRRAAGPGELRSLTLNYATGRLVPHLKALNELPLGLAGTQLGEGDLAILAGMRHLQRLDLANALSSGAARSEVARLRGNVAFARSGTERTIVLSLPLSGGRLHVR